MELPTIGKIHKQKLNSPLNTPIESGNVQGTTGPLLHWAQATARVLVIFHPQPKSISQLRCPMEGLVRPTGSYPVTRFTSLISMVEVEPDPPLYYDLSTVDCSTYTLDQ